MATALRNMALDVRNKELIGEWPIHSIDRVKGKHRVWNNVTWKIVCYWVNATFPKQAIFIQELSELKIMALKTSAVILTHLQNYSLA